MARKHKTQKAGEAKVLANMRIVISKELLELISKWFLIGSLALLFAISLHLIMKFAGVVPRITYDEALGNVAHNLAVYGRHSITTTPMQPHAALPRSDVFFNYGPWYFWVLAGLQWIFGQSIELGRMLHPLGLALASIISIITFRRASMAAGSATACILFVIFFNLHFPMIRPDISVSVFAALCLLCVTRAVEHNSTVSWSLAGASAAGAFTSHQIAFSLPIFVIAFWAFSSLHFNLPSNSHKNLILRNFIAIAIGGLFVTLIYLWAVDFNLKTLIGLWLGYSDFVGAKNNIPYIETLMNHINYFGGSKAKILLSVEVVGFLFALTLVVLNSLNPSDHWRRHIAYSLPGPVLFFMYLISLSYYPNFHSGYVIVLHVAMAWTVSGIGAAVICMLSAANSWPLKGAEVYCRIIAVFVILFVGGYFLAVPSFWEKQAYGNVKYEQLKSHIIESLPPRARIFGPAELGNDSGNRYQLISFYEGLALALEFAVEDRAKLRPDAVVFSRTASTAFAQAILRGRLADWPIESVFPNTSMHLIKSIYAEPYGEMRIYKVGNGEGRFNEAASFGVMDGITGQWIDRFISIDDFGFVPAPPVKLSFEYRRPGVETKYAAQSWRTRDELPPGQYLIEVEIQHDGQKESGLLAATPTDHFTIPVYDDSFQFDHAYYFKSEDRTYLQVKHDGGFLYFSHFSISPASKIKIIGLSKGIPAVSNREELSIAIPSYDKWSSISASSQLLAEGNGIYMLKGRGHDWEHLFESPNIPVPPSSILKISMPVSSGGNDLLVGVKDNSFGWLMPPRPILKELVFETKNANSVKIILQQGDTNSGDKNKATSLINGKLVAVGGDAGLYVDWLTICRYRKINSKSTHLTDWGSMNQNSLKCLFEKKH